MLIPVVKSFDNETVVGRLELSDRFATEFAETGRDGMVYQLAPTMRSNTDGKVELLSVSIVPYAVSPGSAAERAVCGAVDRWRANSGDVAREALRTRSPVPVNVDLLGQWVLIPKLDRTGYIVEIDVDKADPYLVRVRRPVCHPAVEFWLSESSFRALGSAVPELTEIEKLDSMLFSESDRVPVSD